MSNNEKKEIINMAKRTQHYCNLLVGQCNNWLPLSNDKKHNVKQQSIGMQIKDLFIKNKVHLASKTIKQ